jgi:hypothetical protein
LPGILAKNRSKIAKAPKMWLDDRLDVCSSPLRCNATFLQEKLLEISDAELVLQELKLESKSLALHGSHV